MVYLWVGTVFISLLGLISVAAQLCEIVQDYEDTEMSPRETLRRLVSAIPWAVFLALCIMSNIYVVSLMYS